MKLLALALTFAAASLLAQSPAPATTLAPRPPVHKLVLTSPAFTDGSDIPVKYSAASVPRPAPGQPMAFVPSPELQWTGVPADAVTLMVTIVDEEFAPRGTQPPFYHWMIFNIPATAKGLPEGVPREKQLPDGSIQPQMGTRVGYGGMGAPATDERHHYIFRVVALDTKLDLGPDATIDQINAAINGHIIDRGLLVARFHRPQQ